MAELKEIVKKEYIENDKTLCFETTPISKIIYLSIVTLGFYDFILLYRYWKILRVNFGYKINSFCRSFLFGGFYNFSLFTIIDKYVRSFNVKGFSPYAFATIFLILLFVTNISTQASFKFPALVEHFKIFFNIVDFITMFSFLILVEIQKKINEVNKNNFPNAHINKWNGINIFWAIIFTVLFVLWWIGALM